MVMTKRYECHGTDATVGVGKEVQGCLFVCNQLYLSAISKAVAYDSTKRDDQRKTTGTKERKKEREKEIPSPAAGP